jgi:hypothetical protein
LQYLNNLQNTVLGNMGPSANCGVYWDSVLGVCHPLDIPLPNGVAHPEDDDWVMFDDDASMGDYNSTDDDPVPDLTTDLEQSLFEQYMANDDFQFLVTPTQAAATTACCVEVTLLKTLTELEAPLFAFKVIMDWA